MLPINQSAPVKASRRIFVPAPAKKIFSLITNINGWSEWNPDVKTSRINGATLPGNSFRWVSGGAVVHSFFHTVESPVSVGWVGRSLGIYAIHNWNLTAIEDGTILEVEESMEGFLCRIFRRVFQKNLEASMDRWLARIHEALVINAS